MSLESAIAMLLEGTGWMLYGHTVSVEHGDNVVISICARTGVCLVCDEREPQMIGAVHYCPHNHGPMADMWEQRTLRISRKSVKADPRRAVEMVRDLARLETNTTGTVQARPLAAGTCCTGAVT